MKTPRLSLLLLLWLPAVPRVLPAQDLLQADPLPAAIAPVRDQGQLPDGTPLGAWAAGTDFKCGWVDGAFTLVPYLGQQAPRNLPWTWRTTAVAIGEVDLRQGEAARPAHGEARLAAVAGLVTECWDVRPEGVEQSFVLAARPASGDLVVRGRIDSPLRAAAREPRVAPLVFADPERRAELRYGTALAIDADGRRQAMTTAFDGDHIELRLPAAELATLRFPLLVDPLLNVYVIATGPLPAGSGITDSCIDRVDAASTSTMVRAEVRWASITDGDLFVWKSRHDFVTSQLVYSDAAPAVQAFDVSVAEVGTNRSYVVAWSRGTTVSSPSISWFTLGADSLGPPTVRTATHPANTTERSPRVGGRRGPTTSSPARALLVRLRETSNGYDRTEVWASVIDCETGTEGAPFPLANGGTAAEPIDNDEPWVGRDNASGLNLWAIAWQYWSPSNQRWRVRAISLNYHGNFVMHSLAIPSPQGGPFHQMQPRVEGTGGRLLVAYATAAVSSYPGKLTSYGGHNVYVQRLDWSSSATHEAHPPVNVGGSFQRDLYLGGLAADWHTGSHWMLTHGPAQGVPSIQLLGYRGRIVRQATLPGPGPSAGQIVYRPASVAFDGGHERFAVHYGLRTWSGSALTWYAYAGRYDYPAAAPIGFYGTSCGAGQVSWTERWRIGSDNTRLGLRSQFPDQIALLALSLQPTAVPLATFGFTGGCDLLVDPASPHWIDLRAVITDADGDAFVALPLPENLAPLDLHAQWFRLPPNGEVRGSTAMRIEIR
ncbi:MAG: hypothetical protein KF830_13775 [Planctomycetes bacterium]|nr:hypothetical protein [Planctomycetota bacterium]